MSKIKGGLAEVLQDCAIKDGMTISFHHHLRNGDGVVNQVMDQIAKSGVRDITVACSSVFPVHEPLVSHIKTGVVTGLCANYISGPVGEFISHGGLEKPVLMHTHGGRAQAIESGELEVDIAFVAAPACDDMGNISGVEGPAACGTLGYAHADVSYGKCVVAVTDYLVAYPTIDAELSQEYIDYVVVVEKIGDPAGIVSGTTQITKDPIGLKIAKLTSAFIDAAGYLEEGFSFQTGAGGTSLAVAACIRERMIEKSIKGSFISGGITGLQVDLLEEGLFRALYDVQCFDLRAIESYRNNRAHMGMSASKYGNPSLKGAVVDKLDVMILGAMEVDSEFNVNVTTGSDGIIMGGSGGHSDTAEGAKLAIVVTQLVNGRIASLVDKVTTITTQGQNIDAIVTERGMVINPKREDLIERMKASKLPMVTFEELKTISDKMTGQAKGIEFDEYVVGKVIGRRGQLVDVIRRIRV